MPARAWESESPREHDFINRLGHLAQRSSTALSRLELVRTCSSAVERSVYIRKVEGSTPSRSTSLLENFRCQAFACRSRIRPAKEYFKSGRSCRLNKE